MTEDEIPEGDATFVRSGFEQQAASGRRTGRQAGGGPVRADGRAGGRPAVSGQGGALLSVTSDNYLPASILMMRLIAEITLLISSQTQTQ